MPTDVQIDENSKFDPPAAPAQHADVSNSEALPHQAALQQHEEAQDAQRKVEQGETEHRMDTEAQIDESSQCDHQAAFPQHAS
eukprot:2699805-Rhodomonas_salina.1